MAYLLGDFLPEGESLTREFKEFCLKKNILKYFSIEQQREIVEGTFTPELQNFIIRNLNNYIHHYLPKYIATFSTTSISSGKLFMGISDNGEITGIPSLEPLTEDIIRDMIYSSSEFLRGVGGETVKDDYLSSIDINIHEIDINTTLLDDEIDYILQKHREKALKINKIIDKWTKKRRDWIYLMKYYTRKLSILSNDRTFRNVTIEYINDSEEVISDTMKEEFILILESDDLITIPTDELIGIQKKDKTHILYWITSCKDYIIDNLLEVKPRSLGLQKLKDPYFSLIRNMSPLRRRWILSNPELKYYVIEITLPGNTNENQFLEYKLHYTDWIRKTRIGTSCINL